VEFPQTEDPMLWKKAFCKPFTEAKTERAKGNLNKQNDDRQYAL
jgi:hypothetical protein